MMLLPSASPLSRRAGLIARPLACACRRSSPSLPRTLRSGRWGSWRGKYGASEASASCTRLLLTETDNIVYTFLGQHGRRALQTWDTPTGMDLEALALAVKARVAELESANAANKARIEELMTGQEQPQPDQNCGVCNGSGYERIATGYGNQEVIDCSRCCKP